MPREYQVVESEDGFDVVDDRTGEIAMTTDDFDEAYHAAGEMFCDDELMIAHENRSATDSLSNMLMAFLRNHPDAIAPAGAYKASETANPMDFSVDPVIGIMAMLRLYLKGVYGRVDVSQGRCPGFDAFVDRYKDAISE